MELFYLKLSVVECTVAAVHVRASKQEKEEQTCEQGKAICLLWSHSRVLLGQMSFFKNTYRTCLLYLKMQGHFKTYSPVYSIEKKHASEIVGTPY